MKSSWIITARVHCLMLCVSFLHAGRNASLHRETAAPMFSLPPATTPVPSAPHHENRPTTPPPQHDDARALFQAMLSQNRTADAQQWLPAYTALCAHDSSCDAKLQSLAAAEFRQAKRRLRRLHAVRNVLKRLRRARIVSRDDDEKHRDRGWRKSHAFFY